MTDPNYYYTSGSFGTPEEVIQSQAAQIADLVTKEELSKRVVTAHRRLCDERAARIKELESALAEAEAIVVACDKCLMVPFTREDDDSNFCELSKLIIARREKGGAK